jgi:hypothetical protein
MEATTTTTTTAALAATPSTTTCEPNVIPALSSLPIPQDINVVAVPGTNTSNSAMKKCCEPNTVQIVNGCWLWCEIPDRYVHNMSSKYDTIAVVDNCLQFNRNNNDSRMSDYHFVENVGGRAGAVSVKGLGAWVLALSGLVWVGL